MSDQPHKNGHASHANGSRGASAAVGKEWVGGRLATPIYVTDGKPYRPELILWVELPEGPILSSRLVVPGEEPAALEQCLVEAMTRPMVGQPRRPLHVRVADASLVEPVRRAVGGPVEIRVAPTPELDEIVDLMAQSMSGTGLPASYLEEGRVAPAMVAQLFTAAAQLYAVAPWQDATDSQVLRLDVPQLGAEGVCVTIIGQLGESEGLILFDSLRSYDAYIEAGARREDGDDIDLGSSVLSLDFDDEDDVPATMRAEVAKHGWTLPQADIYPMVVRRDRTGLPMPLQETDVRLATAAAAAVTRFFEKHPDIFESDEPAPVTEELMLTDPSGLVVARLTAPYPEATWSAASDDDEEDDEDDDDEDSLLLPPAEVERRSGRVVDDALDELEKSLGTKTSKQGLRADRLAGVLGGRLTRPQRARAQALHRRVATGGGTNSARAEELLLNLLALATTHTPEVPDGPEAVEFWVQTIDLKRPRDSFGTRRREIAIAVLGRLACQNDLATARAALVAALDHADPETRAITLIALSICAEATGEMPAEWLAAATRIARDDRDFAPRFRARALLRSEGHKAIVDVPSGTFTFLVKPRGTKKFSCCIELRSRQTLAHLHAAIQGALGWDNDHLYAFRFADNARGRDGIEVSCDDDGDGDLAAHDAVLGEIGLLEGQQFVYVFDFGDNHEFDVTVTATTAKATPKVKYPRVVETKGRPPRQYPR